MGEEAASNATQALAMLQQGHPRDAVLRWLLEATHKEAGVPLPSGGLAPLRVPQ